MTEVDVSLLVGALIVGLISFRNPRGILWIVVAGISYINASIAWRLHLPYAEAITGFGDAGVCLAIYFGGRERWELLIWRLFQTSVAISFLYLAGNIGIFPRIPHDTYSILMELINWLTLLLIAGISAMQLLGAENATAHRPWDRVRHFGRALSARREPHFLSKDTRAP